MHITDTINPQVHFGGLAFMSEVNALLHIGGTQKGIHKNYENLEEFQNKLGNFRCLLYAQHVKLSEQIRKC